MSKIKASNIDLMVDGKTINIKNAQKGNYDLNVALANPDNFANFKNNPRLFAQDYGIDIDSDISDQLANRLTHIHTLDELRDVGTGRDDGGEATVWAVAAGSYSVAGSKVAVAF